MRQALAAQHRLHHSIFDSPPSSWQTQQCGSISGDIAAPVPDASYKYVAGLKPDTWEFAVCPIRHSEQWQQPKWTMPLPPGDDFHCDHALLRVPTWSPDASYVALVTYADHSKGREVHLLLLRTSDGASETSQVAAAPPGEFLGVMNLLWAPCNPAGRPRLAVIW